MSVDILLANPGGFELCMRGVVAAGDDNPTSSLVPRVSLGHMVTSCKHAPWGTTAWGCVGGRKVGGETRLGATCVCAGRLHLCRPVCLQHVRRAFRRPLRPSTPFAHHRSTAWRWHLSPRSRQFSGYRSTFRTLQARVVGQILLHHVRCTFLRPLRPFHPVRSSPKHRLALVIHPAVPAVQRVGIHISHSLSSRCYRFRPDFRDSRRVTLHRNRCSAVYAIANRHLSRIPARRSRSRALSRPCWAVKIVNKPK